MPEAFLNPADLLLAESAGGAAFSLHIASTLGILLGVSLLAGVIAEYLRLPKVTAYLLIGLSLGPSVFHVIPHDQISAFEPMLQLAMALVLFRLGSQFPASRIRRILPRSLVFSAGDLIGTMAVVTFGLWAFGVPGTQSLLLGCLALATAPATTVLVLRELRSQGPVTDHTGMLVALNNLAAIVAFEIGFLVIQVTGGGADVPVTESVLNLLQDIFGAILLGGLAGLVVSGTCGLMHSRRWLALLVASTTFVLGVCQSLDIPYMLSFLVMGLIVANLSDMAEEITNELDNLGGLLAVLFFAVHGAELDIGEFVAAGMVGVAYIVLRSLGKVGGVYIAARMTRQQPATQHWLGPALLSQAGAAIALSTLAVHRDPKLGTPVQTVILGSVVVFEIMGPLLIRMAVLRSGEVPISAAIRHVGSTPLQELREMWDAARVSMGWATATRGASSDLTISPLVDREAAGIPQSALFDDVIDYIEDSHDNVYPVVNDERSLVGVIRYSMLSNVMFDQTVNHLVCAADLTSDVSVVLHPDDTVMQASSLLQQTRDDCIPVVEREDPQALVGVIRRSDVMHALIRRRSQAIEHSRN